MRLLVLGCAGSEIPEHHMPGFLVDGSLLLDAGTIGLVLDTGQQRGIEDIFISHTHLDHIQALPFFADNIVTWDGGPTVTVHSDPEILDVLQRHLFNGLLWPDFSQIPSPEHPALRFEPLKTGEPVELAKHRVTAYPVCHTTPAVGFLVEKYNGKRILYTGDTGPSDEIWRACDEHAAEALIAEVSYPDRMRQTAIETGHLTPELLSEEIPKMKNLPRRFLISHSKPLYKEEILHDLNCVGIERIMVLEDGQVIDL